MRAGYNQTRRSNLRFVQESQFMRYAAGQCAERRMAVKSGRMIGMIRVTPT